MSSREIKPIIYYYIRRKWYEQLIKFCDGVIQKKGKDPVTIFWKAFGIGMSGDVSDGIRLLESFSARKDMQYPVSLALLYFHKKVTTNIDHETIDSLTNELPLAEDVTKEAGLSLAARFCLYVGDLVTAGRVASKLLGSNRSPGFSANLTPFETEAMCVDYWIAVEETKDSIAGDDARRKLQRLDSSLKEKAEQADVDALMLWAVSKLVANQIGEASNIYNQIVAVHPWFTPALIDKTLMLASTGSWEQALDSAQRVLDVDGDNIDALMVIAVHAFTQEMIPSEALQKLADFESALMKREVSAVDIAVDSVALFSTLCCRNKKALQICCRILDRAQKYCVSAESECRVLCQLGNCNVLMGFSEFQNAYRFFREAAKRDGNNIAPLEGMILCQLREGLNDDAEGQIELISVMHSSEDLSPEFLYLQALLTRQSHRDSKRHLSLLNDCRDLVNQRGKHPIAVADGSIVSFVQLKHRNPDFLLMIALEYLEHMESSSSPPPSAKSGTFGVGGAGDEGSVEVVPAVQAGLDLILRVIASCPGISAAYIEIARAYSALGKNEEALRSLHQCMSLQPHMAAALVAVAKVELSRGGTALADRALEQALSCDFSIRSSTLFRLLQTSVRSQQGRVDEAITEIEAVMQLPDIKSLSVAGESYSDSLRLTDEDRVSAFVLHASLLGKARRLKEANKVLSEAKIIFSGSPQEVQVLVAASQLAVERNDFDAAIRMLDKISDDSPTFFRAQLIKAEILLGSNRDKEGFIHCFKQLVEREGSAKNFALLGEAYLRTLNPEAGIVALESAYKLDPTNSKLRGRIGRALVATHEYLHAVDFYESAIKDAARSKAGSISSEGKYSESAGGGGGSSGGKTGCEAITLSHDLARLFIKLGKPDKASSVLEDVLHRDVKDITDLRQNATTLLLLADIHRKAGNSADVRGALEKARSTQKEVLASARTGVSVASSPEIVEAERATLSSICEQLAALTDNPRDAEALYTEATQHHSMNVKAMLGLATLQKDRGDRDQAVAQCKKVLLADPSDEEAATMLSELLFLGSDPDKSVAPLQELLKTYPNNYRALAQLISLLRRAGRLGDSEVFISAAEDADKRSGAHPGFHFCKGLYARYINDVGKAIVEFNLARKDEKWGVDALDNMIELYLNPNQDGAWEEKNIGPLDDIAAVNVAAAGTLLKELQPKCKDPLRYKVLENYWLLATRQKNNVDNAMQSYIAILDKDPDYLPAVLGMATGFMVEKNNHKATNLLKRVAKMERHHHDGEDYVKANLLLAKFFADKSMYDQAQDLCRRALAHNKSSAQAWEILGLIFEKSGDHDRAAECYEKAWKLEFEASASIGYKLAFSLLKSKKYVEAVDICEAVLLQYPDYPRIREEILKKAQFLL